MREDGVGGREGGRGEDKKRERERIEEKRTRVRGK